MDRAIGYYHDSLFKIDSLAQCILPLCPLIYHRFTIPPKPVYIVAAKLCLAYSFPAPPPSSPSCPFSPPSLSLPPPSLPPPQVLLLPMLAPRSYTREDVVELHCHGGTACAPAVMRRAMALGARQAGPGGGELLRCLKDGWAGGRTGHPSAVGHRMSLRLWVAPTRGV